LLEENKFRVTTRSTHKPVLVVTMRSRHSKKKLTQHRMTMRVMRSHFSTTGCSLKKAWNKWRQP
jgi:hypothetical protein